uniref:CCHC-type domain-containing protein n=1 Tax=Trichuris muris TaxID=70415 RepID=A0A5S6QLX5_TRIMR
MGTDGGQAKLLITKLNGSNYQIWKLKMKVLLMKDGLWDVVNHVKPEPTPQGWYQRECKAIAAICLTVEDDQLLHLMQHETAREMWQALQRLHERSSIGSRLYLKRKLYSMRFTHGSMQAHLNAMLEIVAQLRGMGKNVEDDDLVAVMLCSLPDSYSALITALEGRDEADLTVEYVSGKLLDEYQRRVENNRDQSSSETALKSTARNEHRQGKSTRIEWNRSTNSDNRACYFCKRKGHIKANCRKYKRQLEMKETVKRTVCDRKGRNEPRDLNEVTEAVRHLSFAAHEKACKT